MIAYIKGELVDAVEDAVIVETHGIGYLIRMQGNAMAKLPPIGKDVKIYTYLYRREDILDLYGFLSKDDLTIFKLLIGVSGIGPKGALGILGAISVDEFRFAVLAGDAKTIAKAPGIGSKTAQKLVIELKDKMKLEDMLGQKEIGGGQEFVGMEKSDIRSEAIQALVALGYNATEALRAVKKVEIAEEMTVEMVLKSALKNISFM